MQKPVPDSPNRFQKLPDDSRSSRKLPEARKIAFSTVSAPAPSAPQTPEGVSNPPPGPPPRVASGGTTGGLRPDYDTTRNRSEAKRDVGKRKTENPPHTPTGRRIFKKSLKYQVFSIPDPDPDVKIWRSKGWNPSLYVIFH